MGIPINPTIRYTPSLYIYSHPKIDRISGNSKKVPIKKQRYNLKMAQQSGSMIAKQKKTFRMITKGVLASGLHVWRHKKLLLCSCIWFWHAKFTPNSSKENESFSM